MMIGHVVDIYICHKNFDPVIHLLANFIIRYLVEITGINRIITHTNVSYYIK